MFFPKVQTNHKYGRSCPEDDNKKVLLGSQLNNFPQPVLK